MLLANHITSACTLCGCVKFNDNKGGFHVIRNSSSKGKVGIKRSKRRRYQFCQNWRSRQWLESQFQRRAKRLAKEYLEQPTRLHFEAIHLGYYVGYVGGQCQQTAKQRRDGL